MVELVRLYSNPLWGSARLLRACPDALSHPRSCADTSRLVPQRVSRRLGTAILDRIVAEYVAGTPTTALARTYGIGKGTLLRLIKENGVTIRRRGPRGTVKARS
jgi:hypothetical protein